MPKKLIALLLSGLVLPGLGQLYLGRKVQGALLLLLINCLLIAAAFLVLPGIGKLLVTSQVGAAEGTGLIADWLTANQSRWHLLLVAFLAIWGFAVVDILRSQESDTPPEQ